ncbi:MAG TPA: hypothetical protein DC011_04295 [Bacteroidetes bacterium]|nr:hypothetical protein [Bacteroidota bacterium]|tara:strand:- start:26 stop:667 length:642 start_codon:yes stop_codon:yes gene_type:complete
MVDSSIDDPYRRVELLKKIQRTKEYPVSTFRDIQASMKDNHITGELFLDLTLLFEVQGKRDLALDAAQKAKRIAGEDESLKALPYFLLHPKGLEWAVEHAWVPPSWEGAPSSSEKGSHSVDELINALKTMELQSRLRSGKTETSDTPTLKPQQKIRSVNRKIATPTLAKILESQQKWAEAKKMWQKLAKTQKDPTIDVAIQRCEKNLAQSKAE